MGRFIPIAASLWALLLTSQLSSAQAMVNGFVVDADGKTPLAGVTVTMNNAVLNFEARRITNGYGRFEFPGLPPKGEYQITALLRDGDVIETPVFVLTQGQNKLVSLRKRRAKSQHRP